MSAGNILCYPFTLLGMRTKDLFPHIIPPRIYSLHHTTSNILISYHLESTHISNILDESTEITSYDCIYHILMTTYDTGSCADDVVTAITTAGVDLLADISGVFDCWSAVKDWMNLGTLCSSPIILTHPAEISNSVSGNQCGWPWWHL